MSYTEKNNDVSDVIVNGVKKMVQRRTSSWIGTMTDLNDVLESKVSARLPGSPSALRVTLNTVINRLRNAGISVRFYRSSDRTRTRLVEFRVR